MSEMKLVVLDVERAIHGTMHGSDVDRVVAALAADPETIEELDIALGRFDEEGLRRHFDYFKPGDDEEPWDAGVAVVDLAAKLVAYESTYSELEKSGSIRHRLLDVEIDYDLSDDWEIVSEVDSWRHLAAQRREQRLSQPRIDVRKVLYGRPLVVFIAEQLAAARDREADAAIKDIHIQWMMTPCADLGGKTPRELLLQYKDYIDMDLENRQSQWSYMRKAPLGLERDSAAYIYGGFGIHEIILYYDLVRHLLKACREGLERDSQWQLDKEVDRLERLRDEWMRSPMDEFGSTPQEMIDRERRRIPEVVDSNNASSSCLADCDCPLCQMMFEDEHYGPGFWHLDGSHMDNEYAFSFHASLAEWEEEQREWEEFNRRFEEKQKRQVSENYVSTGIWNSQSCGDTELNNLSAYEVVMLGNFKFASLVAQLNTDIQELSEGQDRDQQERLCQCLADIRLALRDAPESLAYALHKLIGELTLVAERYPDIRVRCADFIRQLREFPDQLRASAE